MPCCGSSRRAAVGSWSPSLANRCQRGIELTNPVESPHSFGESAGCVDIAQCREFVAERGADAETELLGFGRGIGIFGNDAVDDAVCEQVCGSDSLFGCHVRRVAGVVVED